MTIPCRRHRPRPAQAYTLLATAFAAVAIWALPAQAERSFVSGGGLNAVILDERNWCGEEVSLTVRAQREGAFRGNRVALQRLIGGAQIPLGFECPEAKRIRVTGEVDGRTVYRGQAHQDKGWALTTFEEPPVPMVAAPRQKPAPGQAPAQEAMTSVTAISGSGAPSLERIAAPAREPVPDGPESTAFAQRLGDWRDKWKAYRSASRN